MLDFYPKEIEKIKDRMGRLEKAIAMLADNGYMPFCKHLPSIIVPLTRSSSERMIVETSVQRVLNPFSLFIIRENKFDLHNPLSIQPLSSSTRASNRGSFSSNISR